MAVSSDADDVMVIVFGTSVPGNIGRSTLHAPFTEAVVASGAAWSIAMVIFAEFVAVPEIGVTTFSGSTIEEWKMDVRSSTPLVMARREWRIIDSSWAAQLVQSCSSPK
jgi:hypothetical protein